MATSLQFLRAAVLLSALLLSGAAGAQVFKWVDKDGKTHYGEKPPDGVKATEVGVPAPGPATVPDDWRRREQESRQRRIDREQQEGAERATRSGDEQRCAQARRRLELLKAQVRMFSRNAKGEKVYLEDADREREIAAEEGRAAKACR